MFGHGRLKTKQTCCFKFCQIIFSGEKKKKNWLPFIFFFSFPQSKPFLLLLLCDACLLSVITALLFFSLSPPLSLQKRTGGVAGGGGGRRAWRARGFFEECTYDVHETHPMMTFGELHSNQKCFNSYLRKKYIWMLYYFVCCLKSFHLNADSQTRVSKGSWSIRLPEGPKNRNWITPTPLHPIITAWIRIRWCCVGRNSG